MLSSIALKYARALAEIAANENQQDQVLEELVTVKELLHPHGELVETLQNPVLPFSVKRKLIERLAEKVPLSQVVVNFTLVLLERGHLHQFDQMVVAYRAVLDENQGIVRGDVYSCREMSQLFKERLEEAASNLTGKRVLLDYHRDESLIGGLTMQIGSTIFDGSIRTQLKEIRQRLAAEH